MKEPRRRRRKAWLYVQLLLVAVFAIGFWFAFRGNLSSSPEAHPAGTSGPSSIGGLPRVEEVGGSEALAMVERLHGTDIPLADAYIATYAQGRESLKVYVGYTAGENKAGELTRRMTQAIEKGNPMFTLVGKGEVEGKEVWEIEGMGEKHYYYQEGERVVWVSITSPEPVFLLKEVFKAFP